LTSDVHTCESGPACKNHDGHTAFPTSTRSAPAASRPPNRKSAALVYDYLDLAQLHEASMSQAITEKTGGSKEKQMLLVAHVEALQAEIVHVTTTWEYELRVAARLSDPYNVRPDRRLAHHRQPDQPAPLAKVRPGFALQRAIGIIGPRMRLLSRLPGTAVCPTGIEDDPVEMAGWEAVHQLRRSARPVPVHARADRPQVLDPRRVLALRRPAHPGTDGPLFRAEPLRVRRPHAGVLLPVRADPPVRRLRALPGEPAMARADLRRQRADRRVNPDLDQQDQRNPWPWPVDTPLDRARKIATMYRRHLATAAPAVCATVDDTAREFGETWMLEREDLVDADRELTTAEAAELVQVPIRRIREWACATHPDDRTKPLLPRFKMRGRERTYLAQHVLAAAAAMRRWRHANGGD
jgi:hypothetical protein